MDSFTLLQWNVLADVNAIGFPKVPEDWLDFNHRGRQQLQIIERQMPDLVCLQEVDHYADFFAPQLDRLGYSGIFLKKRHTADGVAFFYNREVFELQRHSLIRLSSKLPETAETVGNRLTTSTVSTTPYHRSGKGSWPSQSSQAEYNQPAIIVELLHTSGRRVVVATSHLKAKPEFEQLRHLQVTELLEAVDYFNAANAPVILAGDFNAEPDSVTIQTVLNSGYHSVYPLPNSWYESNTITSGRKPPVEFTTFKYRELANGQHKLFARVIDYIFYDGPLTAEEVKLPDEHQLHASQSGLPTYDMPSDHLPLAASFFFTNRY